MEKLKVCNEKNSYVAMVNVEDINIDYRYQRTTREPVIKRMIKEFNRDLLGVLLVSRRIDGKYYAYDGGHRLEVARRLNIKQLECKVYEGLTISEEAYLFDKFNTGRSRITALQTFSARLMYGDETALKLREILFKYGLTVQASGNSKNNIQAIGTIETVCNSYGEDVLNKTLYALKSAYNGDPKSLTSHILYGLGTFINKYKDLIDIDRLVAILSKTPVLEIQRDGNAYANTFGSGATGIARSILERYNRRLHNKLPNWESM